MLGVFLSTDYADYLVSMYAIAYVPKEVADTRVSGRGASTPGLDVFAIAVAHGTPEQNQRRIQGQPATGITHSRAGNETTAGGHRKSNLQPD